MGLSILEIFIIFGACLIYLHDVGYALLFSGMLVFLIAVILGLTIITKKKLPGREIDMPSSLGIITADIIIGFTAISTVYVFYQFNYARFP